MSSAETKTAILHEEGVRRKIRRMALEIAERNEGEKDLVLSGIVGNGETVARCIADEVKKITGIEVPIITVHLDKRNPGNVALLPAMNLEGKIVIIADDVANTGKTMFYALKPFMETALKRLQTLVLVERSHKQFPIHTDYTGLSIATTLQEHIVVETEGEKITGAWLY